MSTGVKLDVCVSDIGSALAHRKRGGWTAAFRCEPLWSNISSILYGGSQMVRISMPSESCATGFGDERKPTRATAARARTRRKVGQ
jgi:hypothetical protein